MFSPGNPSSDHCPYDFESEENAPKWKGLFISALQKVQRQVHPSLLAREDALSYIENLILRLLGMLCACQPHTVQDMEERVQKTFPHPIDKWAIRDAQNALEKGKKKSPLVLPNDRIHPLLVREVLGYKVESQVTLYIVAVLEYIAADILKLTGNYVKNIKHQEITCQDIKVAMCADKVLMDMFFQDDDVVTFSVEEEPSYQRRGSLTYEEIVKDLVLEEKQYIRDLNMIIKVFRSPFEVLWPTSKDLEVIFSNILEIHKFTANLLSLLEDTLEMTQENAVPYVGGCFEDLAETAEFDVYEKYADDMLKPNGRERLNILLQRADANFKLQAAGHGFKDAVKYVLPKLSLGPIYHYLHYFDVIKALIDTSGDEEDRESLEQARGLLNQLKIDIERKLSAAVLKKKPGETSLRFRGRMGRQAALDKMNELQRSIDGWEGKDIGQSCNEFIMDGTLSKYAGRRFSERYVFLFDGLVVLTKQNTKRSSVTGVQGEYKLKERFNIHKIDIIDREDSEEVKHAFELQVRDHPNVVLVCKNVEDKNNWMAALVSLMTRSMLERMLDSILSEEERAQPLRLPDRVLYRFAEEDSDGNIVMEENQEMAESPLIKGGTLLKLVERLTYHLYGDPKFVQTFLTTYRSFCKPQELLDLLIERFEIPDPPWQDHLGDDQHVDNVAARDDLKRFRNKYSKPVQLRVLNVLRHWVDQHFYDFEWDKDLLTKLNNFFDTVKGKAMRKWVESIMKVISRRLESSEERSVILYNDPPPIEWHLLKTPDGFDIMTLHPIEVARQVTLLEFDLYRAVKPSELVGTVWIKKDKDLTSPNLLKMIRHSTNFTFWLEKCIVETENFEERVAVVSRIIEVMMVFQELNNFNGVLEVVSALMSAPVYRLEHTFAELPRKLYHAYDEAKELNSDHFRRYVERLRSINPPCVPFLGMYLTNILLTEEGNPDFLPNRPEGIINFSKRRKVAEITEEIKQFQNQPYYLKAEQDIRSFFEDLDPRGEMTEKEFNDYLYAKSLEIEPRNSRQPPKFERSREYSLKSPGIKASSSRHSSTSTLRGSILPLSEARPSNFPRIQDEGDGESSRGATPPTPSTPLTPTHSCSSGDQSVFAMVVIGNPIPNVAPASPAAVSQPLLAASSPAVPVSPGAPLVLQQPPGASQTPPPVPPRTKRDSTSSSGDQSYVRLAPQPVQEPPVVPPRDTRSMSSSSGLSNRDFRDSSSSMCENRPPIPPRRELGTLPRAQSMTIPKQTLNSLSATLPRRSSEREQGLVNINGDGSPTPERPPKTYRNLFNRKQSS